MSESKAFDQNARRQFADRNEYSAIWTMDGLRVIYIRLWRICCQLYFDYAYIAEHMIPVLELHRRKRASNILGENIGSQHNQRSRPNHHRFIGASFKILVPFNY